MTTAIFTLLNWILTFTRACPQKARPLSATVTASCHSDEREPTPAGSTDRAGSFYLPPKKAVRQGWTITTLSLNGHMGKVGLRERLNDWPSITQLMGEAAKA